MTRLRTLRGRLFRRQECGGIEDDARLVLEAAEALDLGEYEMFCLAWRRWSGEPENHRRIEGAFARYMFRGVVPPWARGFARAVLERRDAGRLDRFAFGAHEVRRRPAWTPAGRYYVIGLFALVCVFVAVLVVQRPAQPFGGARLACNGGPGMAFVERVARQFTGKTDPFACRK